MYIWAIFHLMAASQWANSRPCTLSHAKEKRNSMQQTARMTNLAPGQNMKEYLCLCISSFSKIRNTRAQILFMFVIPSTTRDIRKNHRFARLLHNRTRCNVRTITIAKQPRDTTLPFQFRGVTLNAGQREYCSYSIPVNAGQAYCKLRLATVSR